MLRHRYYKLRYGAAAPVPDQLLFVNPTDINRMVVNTSLVPISMAGTRIVDGNWDLNQVDETFISRRELRQSINEPGVTPLENYGFFTSAKEHFERGVPWEETDFYAYKMQSDEGGHYATKDLIKARLAGLDQLYQNIREDGYKSQRELRKSDIGDNPLEPDRLPTPPEYGEVAVAIGRDGEIFFVDGRHRLSIARALGVEEIPVRVVGRHSEWQDIRVKYSKLVDEDDNKRTHPDLQEFDTA